MHIYPFRRNYGDEKDFHAIDNYWESYYQILIDCIESGPLDLSIYCRIFDKWEADIEKGLSLIAFATPVINADVISAFSEKLDVLLNKHIGESSNILSQAVKNSELSGNSIIRFIENTIRCNPMYLVRISRVENVELDALTFYTVYLLRPIRQALAKGFIADIEKSHWVYGYCPVCGLWPRLSHIDESNGQRRLWCVGCGSNWKFERLTCPFCLEHDADKLGFLHFERKSPYRIYTCESCRRYLKTKIGDFISSNSLDSFDVDFLSTTALDGLAAAEKYIQDYIGFAAFDLQDNAAAQSYRIKARELKYINQGE